MNWILSRLKEPSTWAGFAGLVPVVISAASGPLNPVAIGGLVSAVLAVLIPEKGAVSA